MLFKFYDIRNKNRLRKLNDRSCQTADLTNRLLEDTVSLSSSLTGLNE